MIRFGRCENELSKNGYVISIDLADTKHKNRIVEISEFIHPLSEQYIYSLKAKWTQDRFHPAMNLCEDEILELAKAFEKLASKIRKRRS